MAKTVLHQILDRSGFSPVTRSKYALVIDRFVEFAGSDPKNWTRDKAQEWYDSLIEGGIKPQSANTYLASLRYVSRWYATKTNNPANDFAIVQKRRGKAKDADDEDAAPILSEDEARDLLAACAPGERFETPADRRDFTMLVLALETGMRRMSLRGARIEEINARRGYPAIKVPIKGEGGEQMFNVPLSDTAKLALDGWIEWLRRRRITSGPVFRRFTAVRDDRGVRYEPGEAPLTDTGINEIVAKRAKLAGIRHVNPHMLRHTFISWRSQADLTPFDISAITGHKVTAIALGGMQIRPGAMETYIHRDVNPIRNSTPKWLAELVTQTLRANPLQKGAP